MAKLTRRLKGRALLSKVRKLRRKTKPFDPEGSGYDMATAKAHGMKADKTGHWGSRSPKTGQILKGQKHKTYHLTKKGETDAGYEIYQGKDKKYYSKKKR